MTLLLCESDLLLITKNLKYMKCLLYIDNENKEIEYEIGESIKVGDHFPINGKEYTVFNILLDSNQEYPIVYLKQ